MINYPPKRDYPKDDKDKLATLGRNYLAERAPLATDDSASGYAVWDKWLDQAGGEAYICLDAAEGAAVWEQVSLDAADLAGLFAEKIGGSTGTADAHVLVSDGTGGKALRSSSVTIDEQGSISTEGDVTGTTGTFDEVSIQGKTAATTDMFTSVSSQAGESTFAGQTGQTVAITEVTGTDYHVSVTPLAESGNIGEIFVSARTVNSFTIKNTGSDTSTAFQWRISGAEIVGA